MYGPNNQVNVDADGAVGDGTCALSNRNRRIALQALAFQLGWAGCYRNGTTGWFRDTNPLIFIAFFDKKYFTLPGGQVHLWGPPEFAIKKDAIWNPATEGSATREQEYSKNRGRLHQFIKLLFVCIHTGDPRYRYNASVDKSEG